MYPPSKTCQIWQVLSSYGSLIPDMEMGCLPYLGIFCNDAIVEFQIAHGRARLQHLQHDPAQREFPGGGGASVIDDRPVRCSLAILPLVPAGGGQLFRKHSQLPCRWQ